MSANEQPRVPARYLWLVRLASWFIPRKRRSGWRRDREGEVRQWWALLAERHELHGAPRASLGAYCRDTLAEAFWSRFGGNGLGQRLRQELRHPRFLAYWIGGFAVAAIVFTGGFSGIRAPFRPLPYESPNQLVALSQPAGYGWRVGVPAARFPVWAAETKTLSGLAAYSLRRVSLSLPDSPQQTATIIRATPGFFQALGVEPALGRLFEPEDYKAQNAVILSHSLWQRMFRGDHGSIGGKILIDGQPREIIGVLPPQYWFLTSRIEAWTPLVLNPRPPEPGPVLVSAIGRLQPGENAGSAQEELRAISKKNKIYWSAGRLEVMPLNAYIRPWRYLYSAAFLVAIGLLCGAVIVRIGKVSLTHGKGSLAQFGWRYWAFLLLKGMVLILVLATLWLELAIRAAWTQGTIAVVSTLAGWALPLAIALAFYWCMIDQSRRCPVCLNRLTLPVRIGSWASALLEPASTEMVCEEGHGVLFVPEVQSSTTEPERWTALDSSWMDIFKKK